MSNDTNLPLRQFGQTNLQVTSLCLGCAPLASMTGLFGNVPEEQAFELDGAVFNSPINFLDTAAAYGDGESERRIGVVLRKLDGVPDGYVLATKADRDDNGDFSGDQTKRSIERSLNLLGLDRLQIVHIHDAHDAHTTFAEMMAPGGAVDVLQRYKAEGVIESIGIADGPIDLLTRFVETGAFDVVLTHNRYSLLSREANSLIDLAASRGMAVLNAAIYNGGILAKGPASGAKFAYEEPSPALLGYVQQMDALCQRYNVPLPAAALQFSLRDPRITSTIVGMTHADRIGETLKLAQLPIPDELWPQLDQIIAGADIRVDKDRR